MTIRIDKYQEGQEPDEADLGDPIDVKGVVFPTVMVVDVTIGQVQIRVTAPHTAFDELELAVAAFPQAFASILDGAANREGDDV